MNADEPTFIHHSVGDAVRVNSIWLSGNINGLKGVVVDNDFATGTIIVLLEDGRKLHFWPSHLEKL